jgi:hypothetical protein
VGVVRYSFLAATAVLVLAPLDARADPAPPDPCADTYECRRHGWCSTEGSKCVARSAADCAESTTCRESGQRCHFDGNAGICVSALARPKPARAPRGIMTASTKMPPGTYEPERIQGNPVRDAGIFFALLGGFGCLTGAVASGMWELAPDAETKDTLMIVSLSSIIPGAAAGTAGIVMLNTQGNSPVIASLGLGSVRVTF